MDYTGNRAPHRSRRHITATGRCARAAAAGALKVDRSFVGGLGHSAQDTAIVRAMVGMAHALGMRVTAEGVEQAAQLRQLRELGCDTGQGYYFAAPLAGGAAGELLGRLIPPWGTAGAQE